MINSSVESEIARSFESEQTEALSQKKSTKKQKKKEIKPLSIEDVFNQVSIVSAGILNPPLKPVVLTPRSAQVCLKQGINPEALKVRDLDSFWELGIDPSVQRMRYEAYVQRRHDLMKLCRKERKKLINEEYGEGNTLNQTRNNQDSQESPVLTAEALLEKQKEQSSTLIKMELMRLEKIQKRQEKELEQMIQHEINRAKIQEEMSAKLEEEKRKERQRKKRLEKRSRLLAEERRLRELQRAAMEQCEEEKRSILVKEMHEREVAIAEEAKRKQEEMKEKLRLEEIEKKRILDEHRRQLQQYFENERNRLRDRLSSMQNAEQKKQEALLARQRELAEKLRIKREIAEKRIEENIQMSRSSEEKRKQDFLAKQAAFEKKRQEHLKKLEEDRNYQMQENYLQEQRRQMILMEQKRQDELKAMKLLEKLDHEDEHVATVQELREKEHEIAKEKKLIKIELKKENVQRVQRMKEYSKLVVLKKIEDTDGRVKTMIEQRRHLIAERRRAAAETKRQKEAITRVMEEVRSSANKASVFVKEAMSGRLSVSDIARGLTGVTPSPSKKASTAPLSMFKKTGPSKAEMLGFQNRQSKSEGFDKTNHNAWEAAMLEEAISKSGNKSFITQSEPMPYISPYDVQAPSKVQSR